MIPHLEAALCSQAQLRTSKPHFAHVVRTDSPLFLKDYVAVRWQDVIDAANSQTLLAELDAFAHCPNDLCFAQELVRDLLSKSDSDSECDASSGKCGDFGHAVHVVDPPLAWRCIHIIHVVTDFCFQWSSAPTLALATSNSCKKSSRTLSNASINVQ